MQYSITSETRMCVESIVNSLYSIFKKRDIQLTVRDITGMYKGDILIYSRKPPFSLLEGTKWHEDWSFGCFYFDGSRMYIRLSENDYKNDFDNCYFDLESKEPVMYIRSYERSSTYQGRYIKVPINKKSFDNIKLKVMALIDYQQLYGCKGFRIRVNHTFLVQMVVFDMEGNPVHLQDGRNVFSRWLRST